MLKVLQNIIFDKDVELDEWISTYSEIKITNWSFNELIE